MTPRPALPPGPYLVVGLARSGQAAARMLRAHGEVIGVDSGEPDTALDGIETHLGADGVALLHRVRTVVKSPGVPGDAPVIVAARERGIPVLGELELAWRLLPNPFVAVTGTNGKTTTVELLGAMFRAAGAPVAVAGNVGTPLASLVGELAPDATVVCEASSFQLEDTEAFAPDVAVLLHITPDHLDRHGSFEAYRGAKLRIFARQGEDDWALAPAGVDPPGKARKLEIGREVVAREGALWWDEQRLLATDEIRVRGPHNLENAIAAATVTLRCRGLDPGAVAEALRTFPGVVNRMEEVAVIDGVTYVNDSKATNVASALAAVRSFDHGVHLILGGSLKGGGFEELREPVRGRCRAAYLIGEAGARLSDDLHGTVPLHRCGELASALSSAAGGAQEGDTVLLSPACASYDQYRDYEERGEHFRRLVRERIEPSE